MNNKDEIYNNINKDIFNISKEVLSEFKAEHNIWMNLAGGALRDLILDNENKIKDIEQLIITEKLNSNQIYKKKNILEWYANHNTSAAIKIVEALTNIYQQDPDKKEMVKSFIDKKSIIKIIDNLTSEDEDGELKSKYYYLKLQVDNVLNKKDNEVKKQRKKI